MRMAKRLIADLAVDSQACHIVYGLGPYTATSEGVLEPPLLVDPWVAKRQLLCVPTLLHYCVMTNVTPRRSLVVS